MSYTDFVIHQGYAEDQSLVCLCLNHCEGFDSPERGMQHFRKVLLEEAKKLLPGNKPCCEKMNKAENFCSKCGSVLKGRVDIAEDYILGIWAELWSGNYDSTTELYEVLREAGWTVEFPKTKPTIVFKIEQYLDDPRRLLCIIPNE